ncbi:MAG: hypothetical protein JKY33_01660, partial [Bacteroidia bacterium]|nr:hypothetical protein [Bacteroidia bacterium]
MIDSNIKVGLIVLCRFNSKRFAGKILKTIKNKPVLQYIIERLEQSKYAGNIIVATSTETDDEPIIEFCEQNEINYFRGSKANVASRILNCAKHYSFNYFVRINGDNVFTDAKLIDPLVKLAIEGKYDFVSNVKNRTFPVGMSVEVLKTTFYNKIIDKFTSESHYEHVTKFLYETEDLTASTYYYFNKSSQNEKLPKLALDEELDFKRINLIFQLMSKDHRKYD